METIEATWILEEANYKNFIRVYLRLSMLTLAFLIRVIRVIRG
jgi:hypothetical protein